jgi:hypothetical protein
MPAVLPERLNAAAQVFGVSAAEVVRRAVPAETAGRAARERRPPCLGPGKAASSSSHSAREQMRTAAQLRGSRGLRSVGGTSVQHCRKYLAFA